MNCRICQSRTSTAFEHIILYKYSIRYEYCSNCHSLFTEEPYWLQEAYANAINASDTGLMQRNLLLSRKTAILLFYLFGKDKTYLDFAGGLGIFVRMMRDLGFNFLWSDLYSTNPLARGFEHKTERIELITTFESFEHFVDPIKEIENMLSIAPNILFSTTLLPPVVPKPDEWWYYGFNHGQHLSFYSRRSLQFIANKYKLNLYTNGLDLHLLTPKRINNNLFYWLQRNIVASPLSPLQIWMRMKLKSKTLSDNEFLLGSVNPDR